MNWMTRRGMLKSGAAAAGLAGARLLNSRIALADSTWSGGAPEPGASIRVLRWKQFIQAEFDSFVGGTRTVEIIDQGDGDFFRHWLTLAFLPEQLLSR